jgi:hypothetical protein
MARADREAADSHLIALRGAMLILALFMFAVLSAP